MIPPLLSLLSTLFDYNTGACGYVLCISNNLKTLRVKVALSAREQFSRDNRDTKSPFWIGAYRSVPGGPPGQSDPGFRMGKNFQWVQCLVRGQKCRLTESI